MGCSGHYDLNRPVTRSPQSPIPDFYTDHGRRLTRSYLRPMSVPWSYVLKFVIIGDAGKYVMCYRRRHVVRGSYLCSCRQGQDNQ